MERVDKMLGDTLPKKSQRAALYSTYFPRDISDNGKVRLGGGFSSLSEAPLCKVRQPPISDV